MSKSFIARWMIQVVAVLIAAHLVPGIAYDSFAAVLVAALVLGLLNAFVKPLLLLVSLPLVLLSFGLFLVFINALLLELTAWLVEGFHVASMGSALLGALIISLTNLLMGSPPRRDSMQWIQMETKSSGTARRGPPPGQGPIIDL